jgi:hypothetical protein
VSVAATLDCAAYLAKGLARVGLFQYGDIFLLNPFGLVSGNLLVQRVGVEGSSLCHRVDRWDLQGMAARRNCI